MRTRLWAAAAISAAGFVVGMVPACGSSNADPPVSGDGGNKDGSFDPDGSQPAPDCMPARTAFEATLPMPAPAAPGRYVVQLVNESDVTILAAANAAHRAGEPPKAVLPREGTWVLPAKGTLTIDIPEEWERTIPETSLGPVIWGRTGCRYDEANNFAQCETGGCGGKYDCSKANLTPPGPKSLSEWTFDDGNHNVAPDISVVDGVNINMDIVPIGGSPTPVGPVDEGFWMSPQNLPLTKCGLDLRANCPPEFQLRREQLTFFIKGSGGDKDVVGCFSNCGNYKFQGQRLGACPAGYRCAGEPPFDCNADPKVDPTCYYWKAFCCAVPAGDPEKVYTRACTDDSQCVNKAKCWDARGACACVAYNKQADCPPDICTNQHSQKPSYQPPFSSCSAMTDATGRPEDCIGDDTFHKVMPRGLTWPNDPETYYSDTHVWRVVFAPGGTKVPITPSTPIPSCKDLPAVYEYEKAKTSCAGDIAGGAIWAGARTAEQNGGSWECKVAAGADSNAVICKW